MADKFKIGDKVQLNVGGPEMAVSKLHYKTDYDTQTKSDELLSVSCQWFAGKKLDSGHFPIDSLNEIKDDSK